jgi:hypothetical protein
MHDLAHYRNCHQGKTIVVCGCGESLLSLPQSDQLITIGVNDVGRLFDPTYLVVLNPSGQFKGDRYQYVKNANVRAIFSQLAIAALNSPVVGFNLGSKGGTDCFSGERLHYTRNSPYVAVCLAAFMGASKIGLIGVDFTEHHFFSKTGHHPLSRGLSNIDKEYGKLFLALHQANVSLVNLSIVSRLSSIPKQSIERFWGDEKLPLAEATKQAIVNRWPISIESALPEQQQPLKILHIAKTNCAGALWNLHQLIEQHTPMQSRVVTACQYTNGRCFPKDVLLSDSKAVKQLIAWADVLHFHNWLDKDSPQMKPFSRLLRGKPALLQFHSAPDVLQREFPGRDLVLRQDIKTLVIAQKHARFYPNARIVPNAIDIYRQQLQPLVGEPSARLRVLYTPTDKSNYGDHVNTCSGKGYAQTLDILQQLDKAGIIDARIETDISWDEVIKLRRDSDVVIDECVTGGYHLTSLEALSQGLVTIAWLDTQTVDLLCDISQSTIAELPWLNTPIVQLKQRLIMLAGDPKMVTEIKRKSRLWMEQYWSPKQVCVQYIRAWQQLMMAQPRRALVSKARAKGRILPAQINYRVASRAQSHRSQDFAQTIRLNEQLLLQRGRLTGQTCHILGSGPSVTDFDLSLLQQRIVMTVNASSTLEPLLGRAADFYCVSDRRFLADPNTLRLAQLSTDSIRVFAGYCHGYLPDADINYVRIIGGDGISSNLKTGFYHNCSVVLFAAQLAMSMGCCKIYLHGCEYDYGKGRFCKEHTHSHDQGIYPRIASSVKALAKMLDDKGGSLNVVGPSRLVGDFGFEAIDLVNRINTDDLYNDLSGCIGDLAEWRDDHKQHLVLSDKASL